MAVGPPLLRDYLNSGFHHGLVRLGAYLLIPAMTLAGCGGGGGGGGGPVNKPPETEMSVSFSNECTYRIRIEGKDPDGSVASIFLKVDDLPEERFYSDKVEVDRPVKWNNSVKAYSRDDQGLNDPTPETSQFWIPYRTDPYLEVEDMLKRNSATYAELHSDWEHGIPIHLDDEELNVDFLIRRPDGRPAVIKYFDINGIQEGMDTRELLNDFLISNQIIIGVPMEEIQRLVLEFIEKGYENDF